MKKIFKTFWNYFCYCDIKKEEFKKADIALYNVKAHREMKFCIHEDKQ